MLPKNRTFIRCQQEHLFSKLFFFLFQQHKKKNKKKKCGRDVVFVYIMLLVIASLQWRYVQDFILFIQKCVTCKHCWNVEIHYPEHETILSNSIIIYIMNKILIKKFQTIVIFDFSRNIRWPYNCTKIAQNCSLTVNPLFCLVSVESIYRYDE